LSEGWAQITTCLTSELGLGTFSWTRTEHNQLVIIFDMVDQAKPVIFQSFKQPRLKNKSLYHNSLQMLLQIKGLWVSLWIFYYNWPQWAWVNCALCKNTCFCTWYCLFLCSVFPQSASYIFNTPSTSQRARKMSWCTFRNFQPPPPPPLWLIKCKSNWSCKKSKNHIWILLQYFFWFLLSNE
jgi:hypothetical protein